MSDFGKMIKNEARMAAVEYLASHTYNIVLKSLGLPESAIADAEARGLEAIGLQALAGSDPAMSDHVSAEVRDALADLLDGAREMREAAQKL